jgi:hypothetical protein
MYPKRRGRGPTPAQNRGRLRPRRPALRRQMQSFEGWCYGHRRKTIKPQLRAQPKRAVNGSIWLLGLGGRVRAKELGATGGGGPCLTGKEVFSPWPWPCPLLGPWPLPLLDPGPWNKKKRESKGLPGWGRPLARAFACWPRFCVLRGPLCLGACVLRVERGMRAFS